MKLMFILFMYFISMMFMNFNNPLIMGILIFLQTLLMTLILGKIYYSFWFSLIIFLVFIGGLFILFTYMIAITYNNKFFMINYKLIYLLFLTIFILLVLKKSMFYKNEETNMMLINKENLMNSLKFFNFPNNFINILLIIYLLILMIIVVKISNFFMGPIKIKN